MEGAQNRRFAILKKPTFSYASGQILDLGASRVFGRSEQGLRPCQLSFRVRLELWSGGLINPELWGVLGGPRRGFRAPRQVGFQGGSQGGGSGSRRFFRQVALIRDATDRWRPSKGVPGRSQGVSKGVFRGPDSQVRDATEEALKGGPWKVPAQQKKRVLGVQIPTKDRRQNTILGAMVLQGVPGRSQGGAKGSQGSQKGV